jgi:hypothetical protein
MMTIKTIASLALVCAVFLTGCARAPVAPPAATPTTSDAVRALESLQAACEVTVLVVGSGVVPAGPNTAEIVQYATAVSQAAGAAAAELKSSDAPAVQATKIAALFAAIAVPQAAAQISSVQQIATLVQTFLGQNVQAPTAADRAVLGSVQGRAKLLTSGGLK